MRRTAQRHGSDEFGRTGLGPVAADRGLGAASGILVDALAESESGITPGPPISGRVIALGVALLVVTAVLIAWVSPSFGSHALPAGEYEAIWIGVASPELDGGVLSVQLLPDVTDGQEIPTWIARVGPNTVISVNGQTTDAAGLAQRLGPTMVRADVGAPADGEISRIEIDTWGD